MNHIYKSIFNKALGVFTAVPEFASAHGKGSERTVVGRVAKGTAGFAASALAISVGLALTSTSAVAGPGIYVNDGTDTGCAAYIDTHNSYVGIFGVGAGNLVDVNNSMVKAGYTLPPNSYLALDQMKPCLSSTGANAAEHRSTQTNRTLFYGNNAAASVNDNGAKNLTLGGRLDVNSGIIGVGDRGVNGTDATNSIRMGTGTTLDEANKHTNAIAIGVNTATTAEGAVAISAEAKARTSYSIAIGRNATAGGDMVPPSNETGAAIAIGRNSLSNFIGAVALGNGATVSPAKSDGNATDGIAIGTKALVDSYRGMAIGANSQAKGSQSIVLANNVPGAKLSTASGIRSQVYGVESEVSGSNSVAMGSTNTVASHRTYAIGNNINVAAGADDSLVFGTQANVGARNSIAMGNTAQALAGNSTAIGSGTTAQTGYSTALGYQAQAGDPAVTNFNGEYTTAIGGKAKALHAYTTALGAETNASGAYATAVGNEAKATHESTTAVGKGAKATNDFATAVGQLALASGKNGTAVGTRNEALGEEATALGYHSHANGSQQLSIGAHAGRNLDGSFSQSTHGISIGSLAGADNATAKSNDDSVLIGTESGRYAQGGDRNTSIGKSAGQYLKGSDNIAMGTQAGTGTATDKLVVNNTTAIGNTAKALTSDSVAIGTSAQAGKADKFSGERAVAVGYNAQALGSAGIAIGEESSTTNGHNGVAIGAYSKTSNKKAISIGAFNAATGAQSIVMAGNYDTNSSGPVSVASGTRATVIGAETTVSGNNSVAIGDTNTVASNRTYAMGNNINVAADADDSLAFGTRVTAGARNSIAMGKSAQALAGNATAIGADAQAKGIDSIAMGLGATVEDAAGFDGIAIGTRAKAKEKGMAVGAYSQADGVESGVFANAVQGKGSTASGRRSSIIGVESTVSGNNSVAIGDTNNVASNRTYAIGNNINVAAGASDSLVFGTKASVGGPEAIALGNTANSKTDGAISIGAHTVSGDGDLVAGVEGNKSISIGYESIANRYDTIAMGVQASTQAADSGVAPWDAVAIGSKSKATTYKALAIGAYSQATGRQSTVIGNDIQGQNSTASGERSQILGVQSNVSGNNSVSIGDTNTVTSDRTYAMGNNITTGAGAHDSLAFGTQTYVGNASAIAMGNAAKAVGKEQVSIGKNAGADSANTEGNYYGVYIGSEAGRYQQGDGRNYAIGQNAGQYVKGSSNIALGTNAGKGEAGNVIDASSTIAIGRETKASGYSGIAIGTLAETTHANSIALGDKASATNGHDALAVGTFSKTTAAKAMSIGSYSTASGVQSIVIASNYADPAAPEASNRSTATAARAIVMGPESHATAEDALAIGNKNTVASARTYAIGNNINVAAGADDSLVFGTRAAVGAANTVAIGANANAAQANSVALGAGSATSAVHTGDYTLNTSYTAAGLPVAANGTVSVGSAGKERQIQNVAAGVISATSTDAINGSQLYATNNYLSNLAGGVKNVLGGDAAVDNAGNVTMSNIGGTGKGNVNDAIAAANTKVAAGDNITVTPTDNADGSKTYTVATKKDLVVDSVKAGDTTVNTDGVTITGGPSVKKDGINAGDKVISGVADGNVAAGSKDAVNGGQLAEVKSKADSAVQNVVSANPTALTANKVGDTVTLTPNFIAGNLVNADGTVNAPAAADEGKLVSAKTVADALKANHFVVDTKGNTETGSEADAKVGSGNKVTFEAGNNLVAKQANTANGGATVKFSLKDDISLNSVTAGAGDNQVVLGNDGVKVGGKTYINNDGLNANSKVISNVADGVNPNDAVNKSQLDAVKGVADSAVKSVDTVASEENLVVDNNDPQNPKLRLKKAVNLTSIKLDGATPGNTTYVSGYGLTIEDGPSVKKEGINAGDKKITNVAPGAVAAGSKEAVNGGQLHNVATSVANVLGGNAAVDGNGNVTSSDIGGTGANTVDDAIKAVNATAAKHTTVVEGKNVKVTKGKNAAGGDEYTVATKDDLDVTSVTAGNTTVNTNGLTITGGPSVTRGGIDAGNAVITNVRDGKVEANSKDAVNGGQLHATNTKLDGVKAKADTAVQDVKSGDENALTAVKDPNTNIVTVTPKLSGDLVDADGNITAPTTPADKGKLVTAGTVAQALANTHFVVDTKATDGELDSTSQADQKIKAGNKVTLQAGKNLKAKQTNGADGAQVEFSLKDSISLTQVTAGEGDNQVVLGNDGVKVGGNTYINKDGLNANNKPISNVADGVKPTDAVNKGQLDAVKGVADSAVKSVDVANGEQNLVVDNTDPKNPKLSLKKDLTVDSVKAGDSTLNTDGLTIAGGPSVKKDGINAGNKKITGVADGNVAAGSTDAVNGGQLYNVANNVKDLIGPDATIDPATGKVTVADPAQGIAGTGKGTIGEAIKSVKDKADTAVQDIKSGDEKALSVTKAGNTYTITPNLSGDLVDADGNITAPATDADKGKLVTAGTVADALANTHFVVDTKATDGELDAASQADQKIKAGNKVTLQAGKNLKAKQTNGTNGAQVEFSLKDSISLTQVTAGTGDNQVVLGNDGVQVGGNTYINKDGLNANNKVISNVADGVNPNDAVNKGQLDAVKGVADSAVKSVDVVANENNLVVDNTDPKNPKLRLRKAVDLDSIKLENNVGEKSFLNSAGLTIKDGPAVTRSGINANNTKVTNVTDGDVNGTSKDAVNGSQLYNVASNVKDLIGPDAAIDPATGKVTVADPTKGIGGTGKGNIGDAIQSVKDAADKAAAEHTTVKAGNNIVVTEGTNAAGGKEYTVSTAKDLNVDSVKAGDTTVNNDGLTIAGGPSVKKDGIDAGDKNITNVADGNVAAGSKDAVNGGQLYDVAKNVADLVGPDATIDPATGKVTVADPTKGIGETGKGTIGDAIKAVNDLAKKAAAEKTSVKAKDGRSNVTVTEGTNAAGGHEYTVDVERAVTEAGSDQVTVTSKHDADSNTTTYTVDVSDKTKASLAKADSAVQGLTSKDGNLNFNKDPNGNVEVSFNDNLNVKNITADGVKAGDTTINSNGIEIVNGPSMTKDGINAGSKAITNVANGNLAKGSTDAVNGGQLHDTAQSVADVIGGGATVKDGKVVAGQNGIGNTGQNTVHGAIAAINQNTANNFNQIRGDLRKMDRDLRGGIAGALATAGLPQAFRPGKSMVAAAASTYRGQSGLAIGVSRISDNGKVILKVTGNTNSRGDFGGTIGAGYQW